MANTCKGFTLIEVLIVMVIISIVSAVAALTLSHNRNTELETTAKQLTHWLKLCATQAIIQPATLRITFQNNIARTEQYNETEKGDPWQPSIDPILSERRWAHDTVLQGKSISNKANDEESPTSILFTESGDFTPFKIYLSSGNTAPAFVITGNADGEIAYAPIKELAHE